MLSRRRQNATEQKRARAGQWRVGELVGAWGRGPRSLSDKKPSDAAAAHIDCIPSQAFMMNLTGLFSSLQCNRTEKRSCVTFASELTFLR